MRSGTKTGDVSRLFQNVFEVMVLTLAPGWCPLPLPPRHQPASNHDALSCCFHHQIAYLRGAFHQPLGRPFFLTQSIAAILSIKVVWLPILHRRVHLWPKLLESPLTCRSMWNRSTPRVVARSTRDMRPCRCTSPAISLRSWLTVMYSCHRTEAHFFRTTHITVGKKIQGHLIDAGFTIGGP